MAGRAWDKHAGRPGGTFQRLKGTNPEKSAIAFKFVESTLSDPTAIRTLLGRGGVEYRLPSGQGVRFNADGSFSGFIDPKKIISSGEKS